MFEKTLKKELHKYTLTEKIVFYLTIIISLITIYFSKGLYETPFGKATLVYSLTSLALISMLRVLKIWGPK